jgi:hypothetical protein
MRMRRDGRPAAVRIIVSLAAICMPGTGAARAGTGGLAHGAPVPDLNLAGSSPDHENLPADIRADSCDGLFG